MEGGSVQKLKILYLMKSNELIPKIEGLASKCEAYQLHRQVYTVGRTKTENENIYYNVDRIYLVRYWNIEKVLYFDILTEIEWIILIFQ